jgi:hypothetical protein
VKGLLDDYMKLQREMIIEERRLQRDDKKKRDAKEKLNQEAKQNFIRYEKRRQVNL